MPGRTPSRPLPRRPSSSGRSAAGPGRPSSDRFALVAIGASAGGLDACRALLRVLPTEIDTAFVLVLHLDPDHASLMVDLLEGATSMTVVQAAEGMAIEPKHLYVIAPGSHLAVAEGRLHLSEPQERHGARLPFDFLLHSLAAAYGPRAACIVLSGTGGDGSLGLVSIHDAGGCVIVQDPAEADYDGMPCSAIATGLVDEILEIADMPAALVADTAGAGPDTAAAGVRRRLPEIVDLLRTRTPYDFTLYKPGTLGRRIERRMAGTGDGASDIDAYIDRLRGDDAELDLLAKDLLINVTSFFRDGPVFDAMAERIVPDLVRGRDDGRPLRIWIPGCSTGEEAYSLAMLFLEQDTTALRRSELRIFATDIDPDAVAIAREGLYPETIASDVSPERLARFFVREGRGRRVSPELRAAVTFTVHDVLGDPPFAHLDLISCRNLLIYLGPEAQAKVASLFHFALRDGGILLLGNAEAISEGADRFEVIGKAERLFRRLGRGLGSARAFPIPGEPMRLPIRRERDPATGRRIALADLCRRRVIDHHAPAAVLVDRELQILYSLGPIDRHLRVPPGYPTLDLAAMMPQSLRARFEAAARQALRESVSVTVDGGHRDDDRAAPAFSIDIRPVTNDDETLLLVAFLERPAPPVGVAGAVAESDRPRVAELERELEETRRELHEATRNLEISSEEQKTINEEALSINEEYQSSNEELLTSKEELQSLNEELTALNGQLHEMLDRQRTTSADLQNVLYSTDVATIFLDRDLTIRFFTPAIKALFSILPGDLGRPLADLHSLSADGALGRDAATVLRTLAPIEREIETETGVWFLRRVLPYRTLDDDIGGVVITFVDVSRRRRVAAALETAKRRAEIASIAKSRFLAAASHDLRQPLQTLCLLQGLLATTVEGVAAENLVARLDATLGTMTEMIDALLDMNRIEAGTIRTDIRAFPVDRLLDRMRGDFADQADAKGIVLEVLHCGFTIESDLRLLEQMVRNLVANALKYTARGKVLLGCRHRRGRLSIEVWDTGIGIAEDQIEAIFEEYHQVDNPARERDRGLGLGLAIVRRLGDLLGHRVEVHSRPGKGSVFSIDVGPSRRTAIPPAVAPVVAERTGGRRAPGDRRSNEILVVEDDPEVRDLLRLTLEGKGHEVTTTADGAAAAALIDAGAVHPDLLLTDFNLPDPFTGLDITARLRTALGRAVPAIVLTGDISTSTLREIAVADCIHLDKPVKPSEILAVIDRLLAASATAPAAEPSAAAPLGRPAPTVWIVDDDDAIRATLRDVLEAEGVSVFDFPSCEAFLSAHVPGGESCLLLDAYLPGISGLQLLERLAAAGRSLPTIVITGRSDVAIAVEAMKAGALDFIEKPIARGRLLESIERVLDLTRDDRRAAEWRTFAADQISLLTPRQRQIMDLVLAGHPSKNIAADLGISQRTVENHRSSIMHKTGTRSLPALARLALGAAS
jgi:two-component system CheB/CheR fusion protein